jgi:hypothetical protein
VNILSILLVSEFTLIVRNFIIRRLHRRILTVKMMWKRLKFRKLSLSYSLGRLELLRDRRQYLISQEHLMMLLFFLELLLNL